MSNNNAAYFYLLFNLFYKYKSLLSAIFRRAFVPRQKLREWNSIGKRKVWVRYFSQIYKSQIYITGEVCSNSFACAFCTLCSQGTFTVFFKHRFYTFSKNIFKRVGYGRNEGRDFTLLLIIL